MSCPGAPVPPELVDEYTSTFYRPPGPDAVEADDLGTILLKGIDSGAITRAELVPCCEGAGGAALTSDDD
ncbi:MAG: hypothetical protein V3U55_02880 [Mycobacterium sp.]